DFERLEKVIESYDNETILEDKIKDLSKTIEELETTKNELLVAENKIPNLEDFNKGKEKLETYKGYLNDFSKLVKENTLTLDEIIAKGKGIANRKDKVDINKIKNSKDEKDKLFQENSRKIAVLESSIKKD